MINSEKEREALFILFWIIKELIYEYIKSSLCGHRNTYPTLICKV